ncbi:hypothetical protein BJ322DRAFT_1101241 [Thelephora terrestris]|uniref:Transmembrane protein 188 n=1 Tax=Thelephora terrestris TaxID=56493 RepID=A0A9P6L3Z0_9AGAM|nr:hypothetical protein BJ322DRAFT_1101241 [Thelephora terrestris]
MPPRSTPPTMIPKGSFHPPRDTATYSDLLMFEERLKSNASVLKRRKRRYQLFLFQLLALISFLVCEVCLQLNLLDIPFHFLLFRMFPTLYSPEDMADIHVHPYLTLGLLSVSVTTLVLFFASGLYSEKIAYANRYVPHANRALRNFNMYLNLRQPPLRSRFPFAFFRNSRTAPSTYNSPPSPLRSPSSPRLPSPTRALTKRSPSVVPITPIPPSSNPRGELIFSSRVNPTFRDSYDRYRTAFEKRKEEKERDAFFTQTYIGRFLAALPWNPLGPWSPPLPSSIDPKVKGEKGLGGSNLHVAKRSVSGNTPSGSRKSSPAPSRGKGPSRVSGMESRSSTPASTHPLIGAGVVGPPTMCRSTLGPLRCRHV